MHVTTTNTQIAFRGVERVTRERLARVQHANEEERRRFSSTLVGKSRLAGFPVRTTPAVETHPIIQRIEDELARVYVMVQEMDVLKADLTEQGLPPLAIVPTLLWQKLTLQFGVYRFEHFDLDGRVPAAPIGGLTKLIINQMSTPTLVRKLWPGRHDTLNSGLRIHPQFPAPPPAFEADLERLGELSLQRRFPICIAAVEEAIQVNRLEVLRAHQEHGLLRVMQPTPEQDPILYTFRGIYTAIINFFGHFPNEERVVEWAMRYYAAIDRRN